MVLTRNNVDHWCERGILFLMLGMLVFAPLALGAVEEWSILILLGGTMTAFILWGVRLGLNRRPQILWPPLTWVVLLFTAYAVARYFTADIEYVARMELIQVVLLASVFMLVLNNLRGQDETEVISFTLIALATVISGYAMVQLATHSDKVWHIHTGTTVRASGTYISGNHFSGFLEQLMPLALTYLLVGRLKITTKILLGYALVMMCGGLAVTFSRAGWASATAGLLLVLLVLMFHRNHRLRALLILLVMIVGMSIFVVSYLSKTAGFVQRVKGDDASVSKTFDMSSRLWLWRSALEMWQTDRKTQLWGVGPGHFDDRFRAYRPEWVQLQPDRVHNDYLNLLADWGVAGAAMGLGGMLIFAWGLFKAWPHVRREENTFGKSQSNRFAFFLGATGGLFALAVHSSMDFNLHIPANALIGVTLLALLSSNLRYATERYWIHASEPLRVVLAGGVVVVVVFFAFQEKRLGGEAYWQAKADQQAIFSSDQAAALERAFACEPKNFHTTYSIGECYRTESFDGGDNFSNLAEQAMGWYAKGIKLNQFDGYNYLRTGMCLDWVGKHQESLKYYSEGEACDPNGYFMLANIGWHYVQVQDYAAARWYFERAYQLGGNQDITAHNYLQIVQDKLKEKASGRPQLPAVY